jgi:hypothetical protein
MERGIIAERAKDIHKDRREQGLVWGQDLGPKMVISAEVREQVLARRGAGMSYKSIADTLNQQGIQSSRGGSWYASSVKNIVDALIGEEDDGEKA